MILCIDSGNSRIKWGVHDDGRWLEAGVIAHADSDQLALLAHRLPPATRIMLANVAGDAALASIRKALVEWRSAVHEVKSALEAGSIVNLYEGPGRLGVDRWCALLGARSLTSAPCVVVMAGTATTIDSLDGGGRFLGGFILPGFDLMRRSLARDTAALPLAEGKYCAWPRCTDDAITSGCVEAQVGAIERAVARLGNGAMCLLSGGAAVVIGEHLGIPHRRVDNLVLEGLRRLAGDLPAYHASGKISS
jgi:type III pantothenate kinase